VLKQLDLPLTVKGILFSTV